MEVSRLDSMSNYSVIACSLMFYGIKLVWEFEWFSKQAKDFKKGNPNQFS